MGTLSIRKSSTRLAGGRQIADFDEALGLGRAEVGAGGVRPAVPVLSVRRAADKLKYLAGTGSGVSARINDIVPEEAARRLREA